MHWLPFPSPHIAHDGRHRPAGRRTLLASAAVLWLPAGMAAPCAAAIRRGPYSVSERMAQYGPAVASRLHGSIQRAGLAWPPARLTYVVFKDTRQLEVYGRASPTGAWRFVKRYPVLAASGRPGPKLAEGDHQVPEGLYRAESLNPNSRFHLSIRLNYPNAFDKRMARADGRTRLGGDIMIHGHAVSIGCLAMGNSAAEELFVLAGGATGEPLQVIIAPTDFRASTHRAPPGGPAWLPSLYDSLRLELKKFPAPPAR
jgi:hypothetical protein